MDKQIPLYQTMPVPQPQKRHDPILEELWAIRAEINKEGNYNPREILARAKVAAAPFIKDGRVCALPQDFDSRL